MTPWTIARQVPLSMGFSRQECWSGLPFPPPGDLPHPGIEPGVSCIAGIFLPSEPPGWGAIRWAGMERWLRVVCLPALGGPMGTKATLLLLPAPQKWQFLVFLYLIFHNLSQLPMLAVIFGAVYLDSILKSRDITLPAKVRLVKSVVFPVVIYGCES